MVPSVTFRVFSRYLLLASGSREGSGHAWHVSVLRL